jgi:Cof subfamily protein (haloacid dehalogenase superfamily)
MIENTSHYPHPIRLLVLDVDGTIAGASNTIREPVIRAIRAAQVKGIQVAIATGRTYHSALRFYQAVESTLPLMVYQGALVKHPATGAVLRHVTVPKQRALELLDFFEQPELLPLLSIHFYMNDQLYVREITSQTRNYVSRSSIQPIAVGDLRLTLTTEPTKVLALSDDPALIDQLFHRLRQLYTPTELYLTKSTDTFVEATNSLVNKGAAVRYLAEEYLGIRPENVMAIGDNLNDLEMLQYAGIGVAMGDAPEIVKLEADWIAPGVEQDGAAVAIEKFLL